MYNSILEFSVTPFLGLITRDQAGKERRIWDFLTGLECVNKRTAIRTERSLKMHIYSRITLIGEISGDAGERTRLQSASSVLGFILFSNNAHRNKHVRRTSGNGLSCVDVAPL